jgi:hypothetical protein
MAGRIKRLMLFLPPQHGKSQIASRNLPAKILGDNPDARIVLGSYTSTMAASFNRAVQRIMDTDAYRETYPNTFLSSPKREYEGSWMRNTEIIEVVGHKGSLFTVGVGGSLTGQPADYLFIDDPVKDQLEASSPTVQQTTWDWYTDVFLTRAHNDTRILITQTRWNDEDLSGKILRQAAETNDPLHQFTVLSLPAIREDFDDPEDPRQLGDALWPSRHSKEKIMAMQSLSLRTWQSLYQQKPRPSQVGGEMYPDFSEALHVGETRYNPDLPLFIIFDENVVPYLPAGVYQVPTDREIHMVDEIAARHPNNTLEYVCGRICRQYRGHTAGMFVGGDATANKEDVKLEKGYNFYRLALSHLKEFNPQNIVQTVNQSVYLRCMWENEVFREGIGGLKVVIGRHCKLTIDDLTYVKQSPKKDKIKEEVVDPATRKKYQKLGHFSDIFDYAMTTIFMDAFNTYRKGGIDQPPTYGKNISKNSY